MTRGSRLLRKQLKKHERLNDGEIWMTSEVRNKNNTKRSDYNEDTRREICENPNDTWVPLSGILR